MPTQNWNTYIHAVGVEVEAGYTPDKVNALRRKLSRRHWGTLHDDGSVTTNHSDAKEISSTPFTDPAALHAMLDSVYAYIEEINPSMGFHIHVSFTKEPYYWALMQHAFYTHFRAAVVHHFPDTRHRLNNQYCETFTNRAQFEYHVYRQYRAYDKQGVRYHALNFAHNQLGTLEIRLFGAPNTAADAWARVEWLTAFLTDFLAARRHTFAATTTAYDDAPSSTTALSRLAPCEASTTITIPRPRLALGG